MLRQRVGSLRTRASQTLAAMVGLCVVAPAQDGSAPVDPGPEMSIYIDFARIRSELPRTEWGRAFADERVQEAWEPVLGLIGERIGVWEAEEAEDDEEVIDQLASWERLWPAFRDGGWVEVTFTSEDAAEEWIFFRAGPFDDAEAVAAEFHSQIPADEVVVVDGVLTHPQKDGGKTIMAQSRGDYVTFAFVGPEVEDAFERFERDFARLKPEGKPMFELALDPFDLTPYLETLRISMDVQESKVVLEANGRLQEEVVPLVEPWFGLPRYDIHTVLPAGESGALSLAVDVPQALRLFEENMLDADGADPSQSRLSRWSKDSGIDIRAKLAEHLSGDLLFLDGWTKAMPGLNRETFSAFLQGDRQFDPDAMEMGVVIGLHDTQSFVRDVFAVATKLAPEAKLRWIDYEGFRIFRFGDGLEVVAVPGAVVVGMGESLPAQIRRICDSFLDPDGSIDDWSEGLREHLEVLGFGHSALSYSRGTPVRPWLIDVAGRFLEIGGETDTPRDLGAAFGIAMAEPFYRGIGTAVTKVQRSGPDVRIRRVW